MKCVNVLLQEKTNWQKGMFKKILANHSTLMVSQALLSQSVNELNTCMRALLSHPSMAQVSGLETFLEPFTMPPWEQATPYPPDHSQAVDDDQP